MKRLTSKMFKKNTIKDMRNIEELNWEDEDGNKESAFCGLAIDKLAEYEDAEEKGLLIRLPCKIGDIVYHIDNKYKDCCDCPHYNKDDQNNCDEIPCPTIVKVIYFNYPMIPYIGIDYYISKEEAELEKIKQDEDYMENIKVNKN